jgi:putative salt-induced outer membrane protein
MLRSPTRAHVVALALALVATAPALVAQDAPAPVVTKITADLGYVAVSGNTQLTTLSIGEKLTQSRGRLTLEQGVAFVYSQQADSVTTNFLRLHGRGDYKIDKVFAGYLGLAYDRNRFAGIEHRYEEALGLTARLIGTSSDSVHIEGGAQLTQQLGTDGIQQNFPSARGAASWRHVFSASAYFLQAVEFLPNLKETEDWRLNSESGIVAPISAKINLKLSYVIRYDNLPQPGFSEIDRLFTTGLQITF